MVDYRSVKRSLAREFSSLIDTMVEVDACSPCLVFVSSLTEKKTIL